MASTGSGGSAPDGARSYARPPAGGEMPHEFDPRRLLLRLLALAVFIGLVAAAIGSLPGLGTVRERFSQASLWLLLVIAVLKLGSCLSNILAFRDVFCPRLGWSFSYDLGMAEQATNVLVPTGGAGGLALGAWALRQGGMDTEHIARRSVAFFVLTSLPNFAFTGVVGPLLLAGALSGPAPAGPTAVFTGLAWLVAIGVALVPLGLRRVDAGKPRGRLATRMRAGALALGAGISDTGRLLRPAHWRAIAGSMGYLCFDIGALVVAYAAFGGGMPLGPLVFAYVIGQLGGLIPLPAGIGGTDGGLIGALVLYGAGVSQAAAAVLAYRAFQLGVPAVLGVIAFLRLRRRLSRSRSPAAECRALAEAA